MLRQRLIQSSDDLPTRSREFWEQLLAERGIALASPCAAYQHAVSAPVLLPSLAATELDVAGVCDLPAMEVMSVAAEPSPDVTTV